MFFATPGGDTFLFKRVLTAESYLSAGSFLTAESFLAAELFLKAESYLSAESILTAEGVAAAAAVLLLIYREKKTNAHLLLITSHLFNH